MEKEIPPYNGWGSYEDSLANCKSLVPTPVHSDLKKFISLDRCGFESRILRFYARMIIKKVIDKSRTFIISCYLYDNSIIIFELAGKNTGK